MIDISVFRHILFQLYYINAISREFVNKLSLRESMKWSISLRLRKFNLCIVVSR